MFSLIKGVEMLRRRAFLPSAGVTRPRLDFNWRGNNIVLQREEEPFPEDDAPLYIGVNSMGIGEERICKLFIVPTLTFPT
jgi:acyl transferase domain-containing protein